MRSITSITTSRLASYLNSATTDPLTLWINWCGPRGSVPDPQGQSGDPEGPAVKTWSLLTSNATGCAYRPTRPGDPFCWSTGSKPGPQGRNLVHRVQPSQRCFRTNLYLRYTQEVRVVPDSFRFIPRTPPSERVGVASAHLAE